MVWTGPETFFCGGCRQYRFFELWCRDTSTLEDLCCVRCCPCPQHRDPDPGGRAVFTMAEGKLTWRGLHNSAWRMRRHI